MGAEAQNIPSGGESELAAGVRPDGGRIGGADRRHLVRRLKEAARWFDRSVIAGLPKEYRCRHVDVRDLLLEAARVLEA